MKKEPISTFAPRQRAVLVAVAPKQQPEFKTKEYLDELQFLAETLDLLVIQRFVQRMDRIDKATFVGSGKLQEIHKYLMVNEAEWVIFDDELSPTQVRNINQLLKKNIYDRSLLILDIFDKRAKTATARAQVALARNEYILPRLTRMWTHLERQRGGTGTRGGAGEKEIETDRRVIKYQISLLKEELKKIDKQRQTQRKSRAEIVRVAIVGYTNAGKSTLMNLLSKSEVFAENKLFATVDATVRKIVWDQIPFLLSDTVGFIRKLPHQLVESFKSTLDEVAEADILMHVVDISNPSFEEHIEVVKNTLAEIKVYNKPTLLVFNKIDAISATEENDSAALNPAHLHKIYHSATHSVVCISATEKSNVDSLRTLLLEKIRQRHQQIYPNFVAQQAKTRE